MCASLSIEDKKRHYCFQWGYWYGCVLYLKHQYRHVVAVFGLCQQLEGTWTRWFGLVFWLAPEEMLAARKHGPVTLHVAFNIFVQCITMSTFHLPLSFPANTGILPIRILSNGNGATFGKCVSGHTFLCGVPYTTGFPWSLCRVHRITSSQYCLIPFNNK